MPTTIRHFSPNAEGKDYLCADLHGMYAALLKSLQAAGFSTSRDRLFCTGDLIDRGPDSPACLRLPEQPWFHSVRGNHEQMMFDALLESDPRMDLMWTLNGGEWHYAEDRQQLVQTCKRLIQQLPLAMEIGLPDGRRCGICHACCPTSDWQDLKIALQSTEPVMQLLWSRSRLQRRMTDPVSGIDRIVCGHSIVATPCRLGNHLFIDTGAFMTGKVTLWPLTALMDSE